MRFNKTILLFCGFLLAIPAIAVLAGDAKSGYEYIRPATRAMQDDDFENPGLLTVEQGQRLFNDRQGGAGKACAECHGEDGAGLDTQHIARYPVLQ
jgi:sulfur-oxidizing protein SoxA